MIIRVALTAILLNFLLRMEAQIIDVQGLHNTGDGPLKSEQSSTIKSRRSDVNFERWDGSVWQEVDSAHYTYIGTRGNDFSGPFVSLNFDFNMGYRWANGAWENRRTTEQWFDSNDRVISEVQTIWDTTQWRNTLRNTFEYDVNGNNTVKVTEYWVNNAWLNTDKIESIFNAEGNPLTISYQDWDGSNWFVRTKISNTYSATGKILMSETQSLDSTGVLVNVSRKINNYNASDSLRTDQFEYWINNTWQGHYRDLYTYNLNGTKETTVRENFINGTTWDFTDITYHSYNSNNYLIKDSTYNMLNGVLELYNKREISRDAYDRVLESVYYDWVNNVWEPDSRYIEQYDLNGNQTKVSISDWQGNVFVETYRRTSTYNGYNQPLTESYMNFDYITLVLGNTVRYFYYYEEYVDSATSIAVIAPVESTVLPNPFTINVAITVKVPQAGKHTFEVSNMAGQCVYNESRHFAIGQQTIIFDGQNLPNGIYFYKINSQNGIATGKLLKQ